MFHFPKTLTRFPQWYSKAPSSESECQKLNRRKMEEAFSLDQAVFCVVRPNPYRDFPFSQASCFSFLHFIVQPKAVGTNGDGVEGKNREQTATLQTALLQSLNNHRQRCGPRYEPLSRAPFLSRGLGQCRHKGLVELACCRSDLSVHLLVVVVQGSWLVKLNW